jgi:hypothetical protein
MSVVRVLACSLCGSLGLLLLTTTTFAPDTTTTLPEARETGPGDTARSDGGFACIDTLSCVDRYLWSVYQRAPKDFAWKDSEAADRVGLSPMDYVIGGMDPAFRVTLYRALRTLDVAGFKPGMMCGFRDDYRQSITTGKMKAQNDRSFHGGSTHGGYGHGVAADIVSVKDGDSTRMWAWIDKHEKELGIGRPYLNRDPPHVAPLDGEEYAVHRFPGARGKLPLAAPRDFSRRARAASHSRAELRFGYVQPSPSQGRSVVSAEGIADTHRNGGGIRGRYHIGR